MKMKHRRVRSFPVPEAIDGARWSVQDGAPRVDLRARALFAPLGDSDAERFLRAHEMAHAAITPRVGAGEAVEKFGVSMEALQACEDARVHHFLERARIDRPPVEPDHTIGRLAKSVADDPRLVGALLVATAGTPDHARFIEALAHYVDSDTLDRVVGMASVVVERVRRGPRGRARHPAESARGFKSNTIPAAALFDQLFGGGGGEPGAIDGERSPLEEYLRHTRRNHRDGRWGEMAPPSPVPMEEPRGKVRSGRARTWRDEGATPTAVHRWTIDGRLFARRRQAPGGTVLVDCSGSMSLSPETLADIVRAAPASTVAIYAGTGSRGGLRIVARRGRVASRATLEDARARLGWGNVVDGPALRWLASQPAPRVWVSDGMVTGCGDNFAGNLAAEALAIVARAGIRRVDKADAARDALTR